ncbi:MAG: hypothetical protein R3B70_09835 [Polyangiaceae bacterium]
MRLTLLRFFSKRPLALVALAAVGAIGVAAGAAHLALGGPDEGSQESSAADNPRKILGRGWFDSWPEKRRDTLRLYFFGGGGIGIYDEGSSYRYAVDVFELERQGDKLDISFLQDGKKTETRFTITPCDEKPPFDLCLDLADSPRGPKRYYGFDDDEDYALIEPFAQGWIKDARARAR